MNSSGKFGLGDNVLRTIIAVIAFGLIAYSGSVNASNSRLFEFDSDDISSTNEVAVSLNVESQISDVNRANSNNKKTKPKHILIDSKKVNFVRERINEIINRVTTIER